MVSNPKRDLSLLDALQLRRALDGRVLAANPTPAMLRVWTAIANQTIGYSKLGDNLVHGDIAAGLKPNAVRTALKALVAVGVICYRPGYRDGTGRNYGSYIRVVPGETTPLTKGETSPLAEGETTPPKEGAAQPSGGRAYRGRYTEGGRPREYAEPTPLADSLRSRPGGAAVSVDGYDEPLGPDCWTWDQVTSPRTVVDCLYGNLTPVGQALFSADRREEAIQGLSALNSDTRLQPQEALYLTAVWAGQTNYAYANRLVQRITRFRDQYEVADMMQTLADASPADVVAVGIAHGEQVRDDLAAARAARDARVQAGA